MINKLQFLLCLLLIVFASCTEVKLQQENAYDVLEGDAAFTAELVGSKWANEILNPLGNCSDSIYFLTSNEVILYDCEIDWHFKAHYSASGDLVTIDLVESQFEMDSGTDPEPTAIWQLKKVGEQLQVSSIRRNRNDEWEEIALAEHERIGDFTKVE